jgi:hypothetical protein
LQRDVDQRRATLADFASISTTSAVSVRFAYTLPSPAGSTVFGFAAQLNIGDTDDPRPRARPIMNGQARSSTLSAAEYVAIFPLK